MAIVAKRLLSALRKDDLLVRRGGEEFLALLGPMSEAELNGASERILKVIRDEPLFWIAVACGDSRIRLVDLTIADLSPAAPMLLRKLA